jgi:hypothetical protein
VPGYSELVLALDDGRVESDVVLEHCGHVGVAQWRLPGADGLARLAVDALLGVDVELVWELVGRWSDVLVDAVDGGRLRCTRCRGSPGTSG